MRLQLPCVASFNCRIGSNGGAQIVDCASIEGKIDSQPSTLNILAGILKSCWPNVGLAEDADEARGGRK